ncbi:MAG: histidinol-phosphate transaminase [Candidatus Omnitrophica bacterium]|nr:histidinol-phosphate transaminase [Candidatus Omnitrophota bacterium]MBU1871592.1 histidinol-phosphate transaminase [Candidatus Omnitrophota bacterium]
MPLPRKNIEKLIPYQPGKPIGELRRQLKIRKIIKLASNENPLGPSPKSKQAIKKALSEINRYPEGSCFYLRRGLSRKLKLKPDMLVFGNGSDELIDIIIKTFVEEGENIVTADITFLEYQIIARTLGREVIEVGLRNFRYDLKSMLRVINRKTKVIFIANPNNPTGTYVTARELNEFIKKVPRRVLVVLDEAYDIFVDAADFPRSMNYLKARGNVIILKTFSKAFGLAGLRIGYAIGPERLISYMERVRPPFNVNLLAQVASAAALEDKDYIKKTRQSIIEGRKYICSQLVKLGLAFLPSVANFILIDVARDGKELYKEMLKYGLIVRDMQQYGLSNFIRVTVGSRTENRKFIRVLSQILIK